MSLDDDESDASDSSPLDPMLLHSLLHEPLKAPPEIEAELRRAKLQLHRPAAAATAAADKLGADDTSDDLIPDVGSRVGGGPDGNRGEAPTHPNFVAADRTRLLGAAASSNSNSKTSAVRARYVDTFNA